MPAKGSRVVKGTWDNPGFLNDLALALYEAANQAGALDPAAREGIEEFIKQQGHGTSWEGIRQHVQKLRKNRDMSAMAKAPGDNDTPAKPAAKRGGGGGRGRKAASKKDEREFTPVDDEEERMNLKREASEELEVETPIKKQRTIKAEDHEGSAEFADYDAELGEV